jgi:Asp/Glu/hydantoin racemase
MKLLLLNGNTDPAITELLATRAREALPRLGLEGLGVVPMTARFGARYIATRASAAIAGHAVLDALAARIGATNPEGFGAAAIACFGDPGLEAARELCPVPVLGMAEASLEAAFRLSPARVALLTGGAAWVPMLREFCLVRGHGEDRVLIESIPATGDLIARDPEAALALLAEATGAAAAAGAGTVVLGGAGLAGLASRIAPRVPVPVLDSLDCLLSAAAAAAAGQPSPAAGHPPTSSTGLAEPLGRLLRSGLVSA